MIKFRKDEFMHPVIYSTLDEYETGCRIVDEIEKDIKELQQENQQLKIQISAREEEYLKLEKNWNELKNIIKQDIKQSEQLIEECPRELRNTIVGTRSYETIVEYNKHILSKMQELEGKSEQDDK